MSNTEPIDGFSGLYESPDKLRFTETTRSLTDAEARMAFIDPGAIFEGFVRVDYLEERPQFRQRDNWERRFGHRSGEIKGHFKDETDEYYASIIIQEPNVAFRGVKRILGGKEATAFITESTESLKGSRRGLAA